MAYVTHSDSRLSSIIRKRRHTTVNKTKLQKYLRNVPNNLPLELFLAHMLEQDIGNDEHSKDSHNLFDNISMNGSNTVYRHMNHIYFRDDVTPESVSQLIKLIDETNRDYIADANRSLFVSVTPKPIYLHLSTCGGSLTDGFLAADYIKNSTIPIISIVEGYVASAGTIMSICARKRLITTNSIMMIHQLSSQFRGNFENFKDNDKNLELYMEMMKKHYAENCNKKTTSRTIARMLKHDIDLSCEKALEMGFVDDIYVPTHEYTI